MYQCGRDVKQTSYFLLYIPIFTTEAQILLSTLNDIVQKCLENTNPILRNILPFGNGSFHRASNTQILNATTDFILSINNEIWKADFLVLPWFFVIIYI